VARFRGAPQPSGVEKKQHLYVCNLTMEIQRQIAVLGRKRAGRSLR
jgi:hypothetical protein